MIEQMIYAANSRDCDGCADARPDVLLEHGSPVGPIIRGRRAARRCARIFINAGIFT